MDNSNVLQNLIEPLSIRFGPMKPPAGISIIAFQQDWFNQFGNYSADHLLDAATEFKANDCFGRWPRTGQIQKILNTMKAQPKVERKRNQPIDVGYARAGIAFAQWHDEHIIHWPKAWDERHTLKVSAKMRMISRLFLHEKMEEFQENNADLVGEDKDFGRITTLMFMRGFFPGPFEDKLAKDAQEIIENDLNKPTSNLKRSPGLFSKTKGGIIHVKKEKPSTDSTECEGYPFDDLAPF